MSNSKRLLVDIALLPMIFFLPWWVACSVALIMCWYCDFYEIIGVGFFIDILYSSGTFFHIQDYFISYPFTLMAFFMLFTLRKLKKRVRFNA